MTGSKGISETHSPNQFVKMFYKLFILVAAVFSAQAQPAATNPPSLVPRRAIRSEGQATNVPGAVTNPAARAAQPLAGTLTNVMVPATNAAASLAARPTNVATQVVTLTNAPRTVVTGATNNLAVPVPTPVPVVPAAPPATPPVVATPQPTTPSPAVPRPGVPAAAVPATPAAPGVGTPVATTGVPADEETFPPGLIKFQDADLIQVLDVYQELTGRTVMRPASLPATKITIRSQTTLTRREAIMALDTILAMNQITMIPQGEKFVKAVTQAQAVTEAKPFTEIDPEDLEETTRFITQIVQLKNALPREVAPALQPLAKMPGSSIMAIDSSGILVLRDYEENIKRMMELLEKIDVVPQQEFDSIVIPIKYALAADIAQVLGSLTSGGGGPTTVGRQTTRTGLTAPGGTGAPGTPGYPGAGGLPGSPGYNPNAAAGGLGGGIGSAAAGRSSFQDRLRQIVNRAAASGDIVILGNTKIIADERTNSLLIFASKADLATISNIIDKLDVVLPQVLIEAIIMEIALDESLTYGVSYLQRQPSTAGQFAGIGAINNGRFLRPENFLLTGTNAVGGGLESGFSYLARFGDLEATLVAAASDSRLNILSKPRIQTSHAVEANLFVGRTRPYVTGQYSYFGGGGPQTQFQQQQIGITLSVLPLINPEGLVVMDIRQKIQTIGADIPIDATFSVPETIDREANAKVSVRDKETIILGGYITSERRKSKSGVPILKDLPLLGYLFSSNQRSEQRSEMMLLLRPTVLPTPSDAALAAHEEKSKMPGIIMAEKDYSEAERRRMDKIADDLYRREGLKPGAPVIENQ